MDPRHKKLETSGSSNLSVSSHGPSLQSSGEQIDGNPHESDPNTSGPLSNLYHGTWPVEHDTWRNGPFSLPTSLHNNVSFDKIPDSGLTYCSFRKQTALLVLHQVQVVQHVRLKYPQQQQ